MSHVTITVRSLRSICRFASGRCHGKRICQHPDNREPVLENTWSQCTSQRCPIVRRSNAQMEARRDKPKVRIVGPNTLRSLMRLWIVWHPDAWEHDMRPPAFYTRAAARAAARRFNQTYPGHKILPMKPNARPHAKERSADSVQADVWQEVNRG